MSKPNSTEILSISEAVAKILDGILETYFRPYNPDKEQPSLSGWIRFLYAWIGSASLFVFALFDVTREMIRHGNYGEAIPYLVFYLTASMFYGLLVKLANTNHGPIRLYLSGLLLSGFVFLVLKNVPVVPDLSFGNSQPETVANTRITRVGVHGQMEVEGEALIVPLDLNRTERQPTPDGE